MSLIKKRVQNIGEDYKKGPLFLLPTQKKKLDQIFPEVQYCGQGVHICLHLTFFFFPHISNNSLIHALTFSFKDFNLHINFLPSPP